MDRKSIILRHVGKACQGIEIGPSHNPIAPKKEGYNVHIIDHMDREGLREKYKEHNVSLENIEEVDFIWRGENYAELTGKSKYYDWIIASHVIEHTPDLIGFLNHCDAVLKEDGVLSLAIPDKRYCFDHFRPLTGISRLIDSHHQKQTVHSPGSIAEYYLNVVRNDGKTAWSSNAGSQYTLNHSMEKVLRLTESARKGETFPDVHAWCFVPSSFRLIVHDLFHLGFIQFQELDFHPTIGCEFFITLARHGQGPSQSRLEMLRAIESEIREERSGFERLRKKFGAVLRKTLGS